MFGYTKPNKPNLRIYEYDIYKSVYCGLCRQMGKMSGPFFCMALSYDFVFLALLDLSQRESAPVFKRKACSINPFKKSCCCVSTEALAFSSDIAAIMLHYKLIDNYNDSKYFKRLLASLTGIFTEPAYRKAAKCVPQADRIVSEALKTQLEFEKTGSDSIDSASDASASALALIFEMISENDTQKRVLHRLGYLLGRWVYMIDAIDDFEGDLKNGRYNPYVIKHKNKRAVKDLQEEAMRSLYLTAAEAAKTFELLDLKRYKPILGNIIYEGLKCSLESVLNRKKER